MLKEKMEKLVTINSLDKALTDLLVTQMLNKDNKDFYIGDLTIGQVNDLFVEMQQDSIDVSVVFWNAFSIAQATLIAEQEYEEQLIKEYEESCILEDMACEYAKHGNNSYYGDFKYVKLDPVCPNCGCTITQGYKAGVACPSCDFVETDDVDEYTELELLAEQQEYDDYKTLEDLGIEY